MVEPTRPRLRRALTRVSEKIFEPRLGEGCLNPAVCAGRSKDRNFINVIEAYRRLRTTPFDKKLVGSFEPL
jgi:hypothetical protein